MVARGSERVPDRGTSATVERRITLLRIVAVMAAISALALALRYQLRVQEFGLNRVSLGDPAWDRDARDGELLFTFFPLLLCIGMIVWGLFQKRQAFLVTMVGSLAFAGFTAFTSYDIYRDTRVLRLVRFVIEVPLGQVVIVAVAFGLALFTWWWHDFTTEPRGSAWNMTSPKAP